ncbi:MAG: type II toxin-antitoxin system RelE/ParE family toxin [Planctomycetes bacterium]|nr:type II toxin-antitoxin system RelE/ParE family toxin [Planctomycetota bacterium]
MTIQSFSDKETEGFFVHGRLKKGVPWKSISSVVRRKLDILHFAAELEDLGSPPGNRLEALKGDLAGFHSMRINDQWRIVFVWTRIGPERVRIVDYHN